MMSLFDFKKVPFKARIKGGLIHGVLTTVFCFIVFQVMEIEQLEVIYYILFFIVMTFIGVLLQGQVQQHKNNS